MLPYIFPWLLTLNDWLHYVNLLEFSFHGSWLNNWLCYVHCLEFSIATSHVKWYVHARNKICCALESLFTQHTLSVIKHYKEYHQFKGKVVMELLLLHIKHYFKLENYRKINMMKLIFSFFMSLSISLIKWNGELLNRGIQL